MNANIQTLMQEIESCQYDDIELMYQKCLILQDESIKQHDDYALCFVSNHLTDYYYSNRTHLEALEMAGKNMLLNEEKNYDDLLMIAYNLYGVVVCNDDYSRVLGYYLKALKIASSLDDHLMLMRLYGNIGDVFCNLSENDYALEYFNKSLEQVELLDHNHPGYSLKRYILMYIGDIYCNTNRHNEALEILKNNRQYFDYNTNEPMNYLFASIYIKILYNNHHIKKALQVIDEVLDNQIQGFRNNEISYLVYHRIFKILLDLKDSERIDKTLKILQNNDFINSGIKYQLELLQMRIETALINNDNDHKNELYEEYYRLSQIEKQSNNDFCLDSVLYKIDLYKEKEEKEDIILLSITDDLTKLNNRRIFNKDFSKLNETDHNIGIILFDLDHFKEYNDSFGHIEGDVVLKQFAKTLKQDNPKIVPYRFGGDEFICLCNNTQESEIIRYIENVYIAFDDYYLDNVTISCGYYQTNKRGLINKNKLIEKADNYLYKVKEKGKNGYFGHVED